MNRKEQQILFQVLDAINTVPGVRNPKDIVGHVTYYMDMQEVRTHVRQILRAILDKDPDYKDENQRGIESELKSLEEFIRLRQSQDWRRPEIGVGPWNGHYYG